MPNIKEYIALINGPFNGISFYLNRVLFHYPCEEETNCSLTHIRIKEGVYKFEVWGGQGGNATILNSGAPYQNPSEGGKGGYSLGTLYISEPTECFINVGSKGYMMSEFRKNGTNTFGGGGGVVVRKTSSHGTSGGGSSDIRLYSDSIYNRVIVAGGGGGASGGQDGIFRQGGSGGGIIGSNGYHDDPQQTTLWSEGANQTSPGIYSIGEGQTGFKGSFFQGGPSDNTNTATNYGGGGGGGWHGGAGGGHRVPGAGGSGFVFNDTKNIPEKYLLNSRSILRDSATINGNYSFPQPSLFDFSLNETGHKGDGAVRITLLHSFDITCKKYNFTLYNLSLFLYCIIYI